jgi:RNA-binding protein
MDIAKKNKLKAEAHHLKPVIIVGAQGVTDALIKEADSALEAHELMKIKVNGEDKANRKHIAIALCEALKAEFLQLIGSTAIIYRKKKSK